MVALALDADVGSDGASAVGRHGNGHRTPSGEWSMEAFLSEWRGDQNTRFDRIESVHAADMKEIRTAVSGIQGQLAAGAATIGKHDEQLRELIDTVTEVDTRLATVERESGSGLHRRIKVLEDADNERKRQEHITKAITELEAKSAWRRIVRNGLEGAATAIIKVALVLAAGAALLYAAPALAQVLAPKLPPPSPVGP